MHVINKTARGNQGTVRAVGEEREFGRDMKSETAGARQSKPSERRKNLE